MAFACRYGRGIGCDVVELHVCSALYFVVVFRPRHYVRVPIDFKPKKVGHYHGIFLVKVDTGQTLTVPLIGQCKES